MSRSAPPYKMTTTQSTAGPSRPAHVINVIPDGYDLQREFSFVLKDRAFDNHSALLGRSSVDVEDEEVFVADLSSKQLAWSDSNDGYRLLDFSFRGLVHESFEGMLPSGRQLSDILGVTIRLRRPHTHFMVPEDFPPPSASFTVLADGTLSPIQVTTALCEADVADFLFSDGTSRPPTVKGGIELTLTAEWTPESSISRRAATLAADLDHDIDLKPEWRPTDASKKYFSLIGWKPIRSSAKFTAGEVEGGTGSSDEQSEDDDDFISSV